MIKLNNTFAIGCLVQWYEVEIFEEYLESLLKTLNEVDNKKWWEIIHILGLSENDKYDMITLEVLGGRVEINQYENPLTNLNGVDKIDRS